MKMMGIDQYNRLEEGVFFADYYKTVAIALGIVAVVENLLILFILLNK